METAELIKLIKTRRSIRSFQDKPVPEALLVQAIETATWAPNGGNDQNWRFFIILDKKVINAVADVVQASIKTMMSWPEMANDGPPSLRPGNSPKDSPPRGDALRTAPVLIVVAAAQSSDPRDNAIEKRAKTDPKAKKMFEGIQIAASGVQSTSAAIGYLMLVLHQMGLGSVWMTGPLHAKADIEKVLKLSTGLDVVTLVSVGYPAENPTKDRKPVSEVCKVIK
jgi:nitroreductase